MTSAHQLNHSNFDQAASATARPNYDRGALKTGIVHLGVGNFHRGHQAVYTDDVLASGETDWGITGVSLRSPTIRDALRPQDFLYSVSFLDGDVQAQRVIGAITDVLCAPEDPEAVLETMCSETVKIVSLTITEKGYVWPENETPDWRVSYFHESSASALLYIVEALHRRKERGIPPFTLLSCDNLAANGRTLRQAVLGLARQKDAQLAEYLTDALACPSSMVDRIVPQPTEADLSTSAKLLGLNDQAAIVTEPFGQWVIEDAFPGGRPDWSICEGVTFTSDVTPYEEMKLRFLNGAHTFIALYGQLTDRSYVSDVMQAEEVVPFLDVFWRNAGTTLRVDLDLNHYSQNLVSRFQNQRLLHKTAQIATDTSQKLPQRILEPLMTLVEAGGDTRAHSAVVALWFGYLMRSDNVSDPLSDDLHALARGGDITRFVTELTIFPRKYVQNTVLQHELLSSWTVLRDSGPEMLVSHAVA